MRFIGYQEAADLLGISPVTLRKKVMHRQVPHYKPFGVHGRVLFLPEDLETLVRSSRREVDGAAAS